MRRLTTVSTFGILLFSMACGSEQDHYLSEGEATPQDPIVFNIFDREALELKPDTCGQACFAINAFESKAPFDLFFVDFKDAKPHWHANHFERYIITEGQGALEFAPKDSPEVKEESPLSAKMVADIPPNFWHAGRERPNLQGLVLAFPALENAPADAKPTTYLPDGKRRQNGLPTGFWANLTGARSLHTGPNGHFIFVRSQPVGKWQLDFSGQTTDEILNAGTVAYLPPNTEFTIWSEIDSPSDKVSIEFYSMTIRDPKPAPGLIVTKDIIESDGAVGGFK